MHSDVAPDSVWWEEALEKVMRPVRIPLKVPTLSHGIC